MRKLLASALLVTLAACGGGTSDEHAADVIAASLKSDTSLEGLGLKIDQKQADCIGQAWVKHIGTDRLKKSGVLTTNASKSSGLRMSEADGKKAAADLGSCVDLKAVMRNAFEKSASLTKEQASCVADKLAEQELESIFAAVFSGRTPDMQSSFEKASDCLI